MTFVHTSNEKLYKIFCLVDHQRGFLSNDYEWQKILCESLEAIEGQVLCGDKQKYEIPISLL